MEVTDFRGRIPVRFNDEREGSNMTDVTSRSSWAVGWTYFAAVMMILVGIFHAIAGLVALFDDKFGDATSAFDRAVKADDNSAVAHFYLGRAYGAQAQRANILKQASLAMKTKHEFDRAVQLLQRAQAEETRKLRSGWKP